MHVYIVTVICFLGERIMEDVKKCIASGCNSTVVPLIRA